MQDVAQRGDWRSFLLSDRGPTQDAIGQCVLPDFLRAPLRIESCKMMRATMAAPRTFGSPPTLGNGAMVLWQNGQKEMIPLQQISPITHVIR
jgi:hypothetical protein